MTRTISRQDAQIQPSKTYTDNLAAGVALETSAANIEEDLNSLRSQVNRIMDDSLSGNWYDDIPTVNSKKRSLLDLNTDLDDLEEKRILCTVDQHGDKLAVYGIEYALEMLETKAAPADKETPVDLITGDTLP